MRDCSEQKRARSSRPENLLLSYLSAKFPTQKQNRNNHGSLHSKEKLNLREKPVEFGDLNLQDFHQQLNMAEDSFLHLARPLGPVSVGTAPTTAPLNVVIQPQVCIGVL